MLGTLAAPSLLGSCTGSEGDKAAGISFAMNYFKVSEGDLRKVLAAALEKGPAMCSAQRMKMLWMLRPTLSYRWTRCTVPSNITTV